MNQFPANAIPGFQPPPGMVPGMMPHPQMMMPGGPGGPPLGPGGPGGPPPGPGGPGGPGPEMLHQQQYLHQQQLAMAQAMRQQQQLQQQQHAVSVAAANAQAQAHAQQRAPPAPKPRKGRPPVLPRNAPPQPPQDYVKGAMAPPTVPVVRQSEAGNAVAGPGAEHEPWADMLDELDPRELAMARFRARQEVMTEIFGPERVREFRVCRQ